VVIANALVFIAVAVHESAAADTADVASGSPGWWLGEVAGADAIGPADAGGWRRLGRSGIWRFLAEDQLAWPWR
jgi:hypothetical protein